MAFIIAIAIFMAGMLIVNFLKDDVTSAESVTGLNCDDMNNSDGTKVTCVLIDGVIPYFFIIVFSVIGGIIAARLTL